MPELHKLHKDWRAWVAIVAMIAAIGAYVMTLDDSDRPGSAPTAPAPTSP